MDQRHTIKGRAMTPIIEIDFIGGTHGNFLEFVLNHLLNKNLDLISPFTKIGTSHKKNYNNYTSKRIVKCDHYYYNNLSFTTDNVIIITVDSNIDLLRLMSLSLYRAGDFQILDNELEIDTFNKLNIPQYQSSLLNLCNSYEINLTKEYPNCPRYILREYFKFGFKDPRINGFVDNSNRSIKNCKAKNVYKFPVTAFYNYYHFKNNLTKVEKFFNLNFNNFDYSNLHQQFMSSLAQFLNLKKTADNILNQVKNNIDYKIEKLTLFQESYINAKLENLYKKEMPFIQPIYFTNTREIIEYINT